jgi:hypothetical protein
VNALLEKYKLGPLPAAAASPAADACRE